IPDQAVVRRVEHIMQRHGKLDDAEPGAEMAAAARGHIDGLKTQLIGKLAKLARMKFPEVGGYLDPVEKRSGNRHDAPCLFSREIGCFRPKAGQLIIAP